eukprot:3274929-Amphidinium_carterae.5
MSHEGRLTSNAVHATDMLVDAGELYIGPSSCFIFPNKGTTTADLRLKPSKCTHSFVDSSWWCADRVAMPAKSTAKAGCKRASSKQVSKLASAKKPKVDATGSAKTCDLCMRSSQDCGC